MISMNSSRINMAHNYTGKGQGINTGLCECNYHGIIIWSKCVCGDAHSWCSDCWNKAMGLDDDE